jgi:hypothetical protein
VSKASQASEQPSAGAKGVLPETVASERSIDIGRELAKVAYTVRYKARSVLEVQIAASTPEMAKKVAHAWVNSQPGRIVLEVKPTFVADESILLTHSPEKVAELTGELSNR